MTSDRSQILLVEPVHEDAMAYLSRHGTVTIGAGLEDPTFVKTIAIADALITRSTNIDEHLLNQAPHLRVVGRHGVGVDNIDISAATAKGIAVINTPGANAQSVAEHVIGALIYLSRRWGEFPDRIRHGEFAARGTSLPVRTTELGLIGTELKGMSLGLVGSGRIGSLAGQLAHACLGMSVIAFDPYLDAPERANYPFEWVDSLKEILSRAHAITLHVPLTEGTRDMIDAACIKRMRPGALLINTSRSEVVDTAALVDALRDGKLGGAAIDVFAHEAITVDNPLVDLRNVLLTPHVAGVTEQSVRRMSVTVAEQIVKYLQTGDADFIVNWHALSNTRFGRSCT